MATNKRIVVIGAGASGLTSIKACKESGLNVVCYEKTNDIGGLWRYREEDIDELGSVMKSTVINSSKEMTAFSDFPPPKHFPNYMHNTAMLQYLELYAREFDLIPHIQFQHEIVSVTASCDYDATGKWVVKVKDVVNGAIREEVFDGVMSCSGQHVYPFKPTFPGDKEFQGRIIHSKNYKKPNGYEDKRVLVVGVGNSGVDVAVELAGIAKKVYLSTRRGFWIFGRLGSRGRPIDAGLLSRRFALMLNTLPYDYLCNYAESILDKQVSHELYQLKPKHRFLSQHPTLNDSLPNKILSGLVIIKGPLKRFVENGVIFEGEEDTVVELDEVILATGYDIKFPFIADGVVKIEECKIDLYKYVYPPNTKHPTLGLIGQVQSIGGLFPISELQARWFVQVITDRVQLPSPENMYRDIKAKRDAILRRFYDGGLRHTLQADFVQYMDDIASMIGAKPNMLKLLLTDPKFFMVCFKGPCVSYQYRLEGPHPWPAARETILGYTERVAAPFKTRYLTTPLEMKKRRSGILKYFTTWNIVIFSLFMYVLLHKNT